MTAAAERDAAWVQAEIPLPPAQVADFLADAQRLWRLNPHCFVATWRELGDGAFAIALDNETNGCRIETEMRRTPLPDGGCRYAYATGLKRETEFLVAAHPGGTLLTVTERYEALADAADPRVRESDKSLLPWIAALRRHLVAGRRWAWLPGWRWWSERFLPSMPPRQRRIVRLIVWVSAIEFALFAAIVLAWRTL